MIVKTEAIVISAIKYGESSLIVRCITRKEGMRSYMLKGVLSSKKGKLKPAYFQPLQILTIEANHNSKGKLNTIKEVSDVYNYDSLYFNIIKQSIGVFLVDVLNASIREEEANENLYDFINSSFVFLDSHDSISNFHLVFLINLTKFLGFFPSNSKGDVFDLNEGCFTNSLPFKNYIKGKELQLFKNLLSVSFDNMDSIQAINSSQRAVLLNILLNYYEIHISSFRRPKSLEVLTTIFNS